MKKLSSKITVVLFVFCISLNTLASTITVNWDGTGDFLTIQDAINAAQEGDTVLVRDGIYTGEGNRDIDFKGKAITVISENGPENCIINCQGTEQEPHRGFKFHSGEESDSVLDGFTITNGNGQKDKRFNGVMRTVGGGIFCEDSNPTITKCTITGNSTERNGAGIYCKNSSPRIIKCTISDNLVEWDSARGGGIFGLYSTIDITNCVISNNSAGYGGGIDCERGDLILNQCIISSNLSQYGGGINCERSDMIMSNCIVTDNSVSGGGGGILCWKSNATITNSILWKNSAIQYGHEIALTNDPNPSHLMISYTDIKGGRTAIHTSSDRCRINWGKGNIDADPIFVEPAYWDVNDTPSDMGDDFWVEGDYHLLLGSPCIDAGDPIYVSGPNETDLDGNPRIINGIVDMGAFEFIPSIKVSVDIKPQTCPNPVNVKGKGVLPVAILGSDMLDVNDIDLDTILLESVAPLRGSYEDVASPVIDETECACTSEGTDGYMDLTLKFNTQEVITALGEMFDEEIWMLNLTGYLKDGTPIEGADCIIIKYKGKNGIINLLDFAKFSSYWLRSDCSETNNWCDRRDINKSGEVDLNELMILRKLWLEATSP